MPDILVRGIPVQMKKQIEQRAREHGQSLSAEVRLLIQRGLKAGIDDVEAMAHAAPGLGDHMAVLAASLEPGDWDEQLIPPRNEKDRPVAGLE